MEDILALSGEKAVILMGESHMKKNSEFYTEIIEKQDNVVDTIISRYKPENIAFYTEAPVQYRMSALLSDEISSSVTLQHTISKLKNIHFSNVSQDYREMYYGNCDDEYAKDIIDLTKRPDILCIIVQIGLSHINEVKKILSKILHDYKIIVINTVPRKYIKANWGELVRLSPGISTLIAQEPPYNFSKSFKVEKYFKVIVTQDKYMNKIYQCPVCKFKTGTGAPINPMDFTLFDHKSNCRNNNKIPIEFL